MWLNLVLVFVCLVYFFLKRTYSYWRNRGIPGPNPVYVVGNIGSALIGRKSMTEVYTDIYRSYEGYPFAGLYRIISPCLMIRDPELIKNIIVKDFRHFINNDVPVDKNVDPLFGRNPFVLRGLEWKTKRSQLTSHFTPGKMRGMFPLLDEVTKKLVKYIAEHATNGTALHEAREVSVRYTLDNVAACAFGLEGRCFEEDYSMFRKLADDFLSPGTWQSIKSTLVFTVPSISQLLRLKFVKKEVQHQLIQMIRQTLEQRRKSNVDRNDFLGLVAGLYNSNTPEDEIEIVAHIASFFLDGYETSSRVMSFAFFELARHPECQRKIREEINEKCEKFEGVLNYESLQEMIYLEACINESMRMYPPLGQLFKVCNEKYTYTCEDPAYKNLTVTIEPGTSIVLPVSALHHDEKFYKSPNEYIPERFINKSDFNKYCFLPFGEGPRACLGFRFGLTQVKLGVAHLIKNFELTLNNKTELPLQLDKWYFMPCPKDGMWIDFKKINEE